LFSCSDDVTRMKHYLAETKKYVIPCSSAPDEVKEVFLKLLKSQEKKKCLCGCHKRSSKRKNDLRKMTIFRFFNVYESCCSWYKIQNIGYLIHNLHLNSTMLRHEHKLNSSENYVFILFAFSLSTMSFFFLLVVSVSCFTFSYLLNRNLSLILNNNLIIK